ncbi:DUF4365 domain-containing protein [Parabacteroides sp. 52]|uniref:DUF4365 domain-containing protein n=1 Tax=unclassified Parabacteroides TaxID=2649774 RepID=UPI0013D49AC3|nr:MULTISPECIES: DUF4365 domain-containing protein [unclassified Parabacteroides]MDH6534069.1 hypothetical protein [Parabacteroides sp. PM5-20]NDV56479.1 DUF4365 domain-containing protein [Parabacteroides sp. 52]
MANRVNLTDRKGVQAFDGFVTNTLGWIFREQSIIDLGIDAHIEQVKNGDSTGALIAVQIKTGLSNVKVNKNGDYDYYMSRVHYNYWLSYSIPVIIVLFDPDGKNLYWASVAKRNMLETGKGNYKITIKKDMVCSNNTIVDFEEIITLHKPCSFTDDLPEITDKSELLNYCTELFHQCSESLLKMREHIDKLSKDYDRGSERMQSFIVNNSSGWTKQMAEKEIKIVKNSFTLSVNICRARISNEIPVLINIFIKTITYLEYFLLNIADAIEVDIFKHFTSNSLSGLKESIDFLIKSIDKVVDFFTESEGEYGDFVRSRIQFAKTIKNYQCELINLSRLTHHLINEVCDS